jgi:hypothetical protein
MSGGVGHEWRDTGGNAPSITGRKIESVREPRPTRRGSLFWLYVAPFGARARSAAWPWLFVWMSPPDLVDGRASIMGHAPALGFPTGLELGGRNVGTGNDEVVIDAAKGDRHRSILCSATRASCPIATCQKKKAPEKGAQVACSGMESEDPFCLTYWRVSVLPKIRAACSSSTLAICYPCHLCGAAYFIAVR